MIQIMFEISYVFMNMVCQFPIAFLWAIAKIPFVEFILIEIEAIFSILAILNNSYVDVLYIVALPFIIKL